MSLLKDGKCILLYPFALLFVYFIFLKYEDTSDFYWLFVLELLTILYK